MIENKTAYPLAWPDGKPRTSHRKTNSHFKKTFAAARDLCTNEIRRLGGTDLIISTNIPLKRNGVEAYATKWGQLLSDPGVAVYFKRKGKQLCFACDSWHHVQDNMYAVALTIEALRGIARWGTGDMMEQAFRGFTAIPERSSHSIYEVLQVPINATEEQIKESYLKLVKKFHPDVFGGDPEKFILVKKAWDEFQKLRNEAV